MDHSLMDMGITRTAAYVYEDSMSRHVLASGHPMRPVRLRYTASLLGWYGLFDHARSSLITPTPANLEEVASFHTIEYIEAVRMLSAGEREDGSKYGFSVPGDNPIYDGMYEAALLSTGASVQAAKLIAEGTVDAAFAPAGGLHHAMPDHASGFCIFNDPVVAINVLRSFGLRVVYIDIDAHHGDGVQAAFYRDDDVLTISLHEGPRWLFPGTGSVSEIGEGRGIGFAVNIPLAPYTSDQVLLDAYDDVVTPLISSFKPDVIATQLGADSYVTDPLSHLEVTTIGYVGLLERLSETRLPWLAFGGGGYDIDAVVRCWTLAYAIILGLELPDLLPRGLEFTQRRRLRDTKMDQERADVDRAVSFVEQQVEQIRKSVFPIHGID